MEFPIFFEGRGEKMSDLLLIYQRKYQKVGKYIPGVCLDNLFGLFKTALIIRTNLMNYLENAKNVEVK